MNILNAKTALDKIINKARVHLYKPIQIAEILYKFRTQNGIDLEKLETYRTQSRKWRDIICVEFLGRTSTSSARYQDDVFNENAVPPEAILALGQENNKKNGIVEAYIYRRFQARFSQLSIGVQYCMNQDMNSFQLEDFINKFWNEPGLRRSIDKVYEIVVYSLLSTVVEAIDLKVDIYYDQSKTDILYEFDNFSEKILGFDDSIKKLTISGKINRGGVTNAADRGLDMWANFGLAIQVKHLSLTEELAEDIVNSVTADRIIIVCRSSEKKVIISLLNQLGWKSRIQSIITETELISWYETALRGRFSSITGQKLLENIINELIAEFPSTNTKDFDRFIKARNYDKLLDNIWT